MRLEDVLPGRSGVEVVAGAPAGLLLAEMLRAAIYLHFAHEVSGRSRPVIPCANPRCTRYFEPEHGNQDYCSEQCRKRAYYHRQADGP